MFIQKIIEENVFGINSLLKGKAKALSSTKFSNVNSYRYHKKLEKLKNKKLFFIDRDGTLMNHQTVIFNATEFIKKLKTNNKLFYILTNNSSKTKSHHLEIFKKYGFDLNLEQMLVSTDTLIRYLKQKNIFSIYLVANKLVKEYFEISGFILRDKTPQAVVLTYDTEISFEKLKTACFLIDRGILYFATHTDLVCPVNKGFVPDIGTYINTIEACTGKKPFKTFGKPYLSSIEPILEKHKLDLKDAVVIGDRLYTDIEMGKDNDLTTVLVLSGETKKQNLLNTKIKPDIVVEGISDLLQFL